MICGHGKEVVKAQGEGVGGEEWETGSGRRTKHY